tara:strand:- start:11837 stop:13198 length:1362 start_codon:yes stop_codon:yes gene_type:complete
MNFLNSTNVFEGVVQLNLDPSASNHAVSKSWLEASAIMGIHADSQVHAETIMVGGEKQLKIKSLAITDVQVDTTAASLTAWIASNYTVGSEVQEGDMIILTNTASNRTESWIHNGGSAVAAADFTEIQGSDIEGSEVRSFFSGGSGITYNAATGAISVTTADVRGLFSGDGVVAYDAANGAFSLVADTDNVSEGSNLYFTNSRAQGAISISGTGLAYAAGVISLAADTDDVAEGTNLYYTDARSRLSVQASVLASPAIQLLTVDQSTGNFSVPLSGVFSQFSAGNGLTFSGGDYSFTGNTGNVTEGSNLYFTNARAQGAISISGSGLAYSAGVISLAADTDDVAEGSNLYHTTARARSSVQANSAAGNMISYNQASGDLLVQKSDFRFSSANASLTANTWLTINHNLGERLVHVSAYDSTGNLVQLDVQLVDTNNCKIKSTIGKTGMDLIVSI